MLICDRFEEGFAVIYDDDRHFNVPESQVDTNVREGDAVVLSDGKYITDKSETERLKKQNLELMKKIGLYKF